MQAISHYTIQSGREAVKKIVTDAYVRDEERVAGLKELEATEWEKDLRFLT